MKSIKRTNLTIVSQTFRLLTCSIKVSLGGRVDLLLERDELESEPTTQYIYIRTEKLNFKVLAFLMQSGTFVSFLVGLDRIQVVLCMLHCPNGP